MKRVGEHYDDYGKANEAAKTAAVYIEEGYSRGWSVGMKRVRRILDQGGEDGLFASSF